MSTQNLAYSERKQEMVSEVMLSVKSHLRDDSTPDDLPANLFLPVVSSFTDAAINYIGSAETARRQRRARHLQSEIYDPDHLQLLSQDLNDRGQTMLERTQDDLSRFEERALDSPYGAESPVGETLHEIKYRVRDTLVDLDAKPADATAISDTASNVLNSLASDGIEGLSDELEIQLNSLAAQRDIEENGYYGYATNVSPLSIAIVAVTAGAVGWYAYKCHHKQDDGRCRQRHQTTTLIVSTASVAVAVV